MGQWRMNQEELTLTICTLCLELYFKVVLLMKVCVQAIWENVATKVKLLCVICKLSCKVCSQESCSLELECKAGGKFHVSLSSFVAKTPGPVDESQERASDLEKALVGIFRNFRKPSRNSPKIRASSRLLQ